MKSLFIGGDSDGKRISIPDKSPYMRCLRVPRPVLMIREDASKYRPIEAETYRRHEIAANNLRLFVYVLDSLTIEDAMQMLINNYKPEKP